MKYIYKENGTYVGYSDIISSTDNPNVIGELVEDEVALELDALRHSRILLQNELRQELQKAKEDVEQVELFGMPRPDYAEKKARCKDIILELRILER